jgi:hypothetical protein
MFMYFSTYALARLVLKFSSFFTLLETYGLQLQHLLPHSITLVAVFVHHFEMYVAMQPSGHLFRLYNVFPSARYDARPIGGYYFQHRLKGPTSYIVTVTPGMWDHWRYYWVVMQGEVYDRLVLPIATQSNCSC